MKYILLTITTIIIFPSCYKVMDYDNSDYEPLLVLNGIVYQDSIFTVNVSHTINMLVNDDSADLFIDDATVKLYKDDQLIEELKYDSLGFYHSIAIAETEHVYKITVEKEGFETAWGTIGFSSGFNIQVSDFDSFIRDSTYEYNSDTPFINLKNVNLNFNLTINDNPNEKNYYGVRMKGFEDYISQGTICERSQYIDTCYDYIQYVQKGYDNIYLNYVFENDNLYEILDRDYLEHYNIGWHYLSAIDDDFFSVYQNSFDFESGYTTETIRPVDLYVFSYPEELIKYCKSANLYEDVEYNSFAEPVNVNSNIENGAGFLAGITAKKITFDLQ